MSLKLIIAILILMCIPNIAADELNLTNDTNISIPYVSWIEGSIQDASMGQSSGFPSLNIINGKKIITFKYPTDGDLQGNHGQIYMRVLDDNNILSQPVLLFGDGGVHNYDASELVNMSDGTVWAISSKVPSHGLVYKISYNNATTFGAEQVLPNVVDGGYPYALDEHYKIYNGIVYLPIYVWDNSSNTQHIKAGVYMTNDSGLNWSFSFFDPRGWDGVAGSEGSIIWTGGNDMIAIWRAILSSPAQTTWKSESHDMGLTFENVTDIGTANGGIFPFLADVELTRFDNATVLTAIDSMDGSTQGLSAWVSVDNITWGNKNTLITEARGEIGYHGIEYAGTNEAYIVYNSGGSFLSASMGTGKINLTESVHKAITAKAISSSSSSGSGGYHSITSGGGGGGGASVASSENYSNVLKYEEHSRNLLHSSFVAYNFSLPVYQVLLKGKENEYDVSVRVELLKNASNESNKPNSEVIQYFNVITSSRRINESIIRFKVNGSNIPVELYLRNQSGWDRLLATDDPGVLNALSKGEDNNSTYYTYQIHEPESMMSFAIVKLESLATKEHIDNTLPPSGIQFASPVFINSTPTATAIATPEQIPIVYPPPEITVLLFVLGLMIVLAVIIFSEWLARYKYSR